MEAGITITGSSGTNLKIIVLSLFVLLFVGSGICDKVSSSKKFRNPVLDKIQAAKNVVTATQELQDRGIPKDYNINDPPLPSNGKPVDVDVAVTVFDIRDIVEMNGEMTLEINLRMTWTDVRLKHMANNWKYAVVHPALLSKIWHPDIYIDHVKKVSSPTLMSIPAYLRIYNDSTIKYSARLTIGMSCQMDFHLYPADTQRCNIDMKSYAYLDDALHLAWDAGKEAAIKKGLSLPNYIVALGDTDYFTTITSAGHYTGLRFTVVLRRKLNFHLIQTYVPSALFVIISWLSFLVAPEMVPGRMTVCMTTLLTLIAMFASIRQNSPSVSYVKGLDIWMVSCVFFVFLTLLEYTTVLKLRSVKPIDPDEKPPMIDCGKLAARLEKYCSKLIPLLYVIFIFVYWPWLLMSADYYNETELKQTRFEN